MPKSRTSPKLLAAAFAATVLMPSSAMAAGGCDWYVTQSLKQWAENVSKKCSKSGEPKWSASKKVHKDWCVSTPPPVWKAMVKLRATELAACK